MAGPVATIAPGPVPLREARLWVQPGPADSRQPIPPDPPVQLKGHAVVAGFGKSEAQLGADEVFCGLVEREATISDVAEAVGVNGPALSGHKRRRRTGRQIGDLTRGC